MQCYICSLTSDQAGMAAGYRICSRRDHWGCAPINALLAVLQAQCLCLRKICIICAELQHDMIGS